MSSTLVSEMRNVSGSSGIVSAFTVRGIEPSMSPSFRMMEELVTGI